MSTGPAQPDGEQQVFICYRRQECAAYAGRLYDAMVDQFGPGNVFMDLDMQPGVDFTERITRVVSGCRALLVVIGPEWASATGEHARPRIGEDDDFVRLEVETGLGHATVTAIPVLVGGAEMPRPEQLPEALRAITRRNALELSNRNWRHDIARLGETIEMLRPRWTPRAKIPAPQLVLEGILVAATVAYAGRALGDKLSFDSTIENVTMRRMLGSALLAAALALWLALRTGRTRPLQLARIVFASLLLGVVAGCLSGLIWGGTWNPAEAFGDTHLLKSDLDRRDVFSTVPLGALTGGLLGWLWFPRRVVASIAVGIGAAMLAQQLCISVGINEEVMPGVARTAAIVAASSVGASLVAMIALSYRSSAAATEPGAR